MSDVPSVLLAPRSSEHIYTNHGWWCAECTDHLFDLDEQTDRTEEWIHTLYSWCKIGLVYLGQGTLALGGSILALILAIAWIIICFCDGVESDTRQYEKDLKDRDHLDRKDRDALSADHARLLAERQRILISIDQAKAQLAKPYVPVRKINEADKDFYVAGGYENEHIGDVHPAVKLKNYLDGLQKVECDLNELEARLYLHKMV